MWTKTRSLMLSRVLTVGAAAAALVLMFFIPRFAEWYEEISVGRGVIGGSIAAPLTVTLFFTTLLFLAVLAALHILLSNISRGSVFTDSNTRCLRFISWACMLAGAAFFVFGLWRFIFMAAGAMAVFFGLIMRVLKNVFAAAVELKQDNDYTI